MEAINSKNQAKKLEEKKSVGPTENSQTEVTDRQIQEKRKMNLQSVAC